MNDAVAIDLSKVLDRPKLAASQIVILCLCSLVIMLDGFDTQAIGYVAPRLLKVFQVSKADLGPLFSFGVAGLFIGSLAISPIADRLGRKVAIIGSVLLFGVCTLLTVTAGSLHSVLFWRFVTGLGLGGAIPTTLTMVADFSPLRLRGTLATLVALANTIGSSLGAILAGILIPAFGWQSVFLVGGILPIILILVLIFFLPESPRWLILQPDSSRRLKPIVRRIDPAIAMPENPVFLMSETQLAGVPVRHLFTDRRSIATLLIWLSFIVGYLDLYFMSNWLPTLITSSGNSLQQAVAAPALLQIGGLIGGIVLARLVDRYSSRMLTVTFAIGAAFIFLTGLVSGQIWLLLAAVSGTGFFVIASIVGCVGYSATFYPTAIRSTGVGWAMGMGRLGAIVGPLVAGILIAMDWSTQSLFFAAAGTTLIGAIAMSLLPRLTPRTTPALH